MFFNHPVFHSLCGYAVTNLALSSLRSTIQIVFTKDDLPPGDSI
jgi:hypothetical protein